MTLTVLSSIVFVFTVTVPEEEPIFNQLAGTAVVPSVSTSESVRAHEA